MTLTKNFESTTNYQLIILLMLAVGLNINTLFHNYAFDDEVVILGNTLVEKGFKGIPDIISHDYFYGYKNIDQNGLSGGRYRPVALVIFAIERQFFGKNPMISHAINITLFALLIALLYKLLHFGLFKGQNKYLAFVTCLLFVVHPIHTEAIANIKGRDEIITFILLIVSLITFIKHILKRSIGLLLAGLFCFFLALLTKETSVTFVTIVPLILYFFLNHSIKKSILFSLPLVAVFVGYMLLRFMIIGYSTYTETEILNAPFLFASASEAFATKVFILCKYVFLLFFPHPLSADYSYNQIPYIDINSIQFLLSTLLLCGLLIYAICTFKKRSIYSFSILYFMLTIFLVSNFVVNIGAPLAERFLFQPSLAFCMAVAGFYIQSVTKFKWISTGVLLIVLLLFSVKTYTRNADWKNDETLWVTDVISTPNSIRSNLFAASSYIIMAKTETNVEVKNEYLKKAIALDEKVLKIYSHYRFTDLFGDLGFAYFGLQDYFKAADIWLMSDKSDPFISSSIEMLSKVMYNEGNKFQQMRDTGTAIRYYKKAVELNDSNVDAWYNLTQCYYLINDTIHAAEAWKYVSFLDPNRKLNKDEILK